MPESNWKKAGKILLWLILSAVALYILYLLTDLLIVLIISILLALIFDPFVKQLEKEGVIDQSHSHWLINLKKLETAVSNR